MQALVSAAKCVGPLEDDPLDLDTRSASAPALGWSLKWRNGRNSAGGSAAHPSLRDPSEAPSRAGIPGMGWGSQPTMLLRPMQSLPAAGACDGVWEGGGRARAVAS